MWTMWDVWWVCVYLKYSSLPFAISSAQPIQQHTRITRILFDILFIFLLAYLDVALLLYLYFLLYCCKIAFINKLVNICEYTREHVYIRIRLYTISFQFITSQPPLTAHSHTIRTHYFSLSNYIIIVQTARDVDRKWWGFSSYKF